jgi:hypothetical protein
MTHDNMEWSVSSTNGQGTVRYGTGMKTWHACLCTHDETNSIPYAYFLEQCICSSPSLSAFPFPA